MESSKSQQMPMVSSARWPTAISYVAPRDPTFGSRFTVPLQLRRSFTRALTRTARFRTMYSTASAAIVANRALVCSSSTQTAPQMAVRSRRVFDATRSMPASDRVAGGAHSTDPDSARIDRKQPPSGRPRSMQQRPPQPAPALLRLQRLRHPRPRLRRPRPRRSRRLRLQQPPHPPPRPLLLLQHFQNDNKLIDFDNKLTKQWLRWANNKLHQPRLLHSGSISRT